MFVLRTLATIVVLVAATVQASQNKRPPQDDTQYVQFTGNADTLSVSQPYLGGYNNNYDYGHHRAPQQQAPTYSQQQHYIGQPQDDYLQGPMINENTHNSGNNLKRGLSRITSRFHLNSDPNYSTEYHVPEELKNRGIKQIEFSQLSPQQALKVLCCRVKLPSKKCDEYIDKLTQLRPREVELLHKDLINKASYESVARNFLQMAKADIRSKMHFYLLESSMESDLDNLEC
ncbi:hypothetical protein GZH46_02865 [Fragariocoptes setiger]|uniref:Uncharacterized protein n=1 Tax=Fragariocoptes setiger TaxID=1670756 RepID=A0ABQ7S5L3_9ACAR|nr:hypothetical protein GZH46_02865 [Fragariocoptes setiger]